MKTENGDNKMRGKKIFLTILLIFFHNAPLFCSMSSGYVIRMDKFTLTIHFYENNDALWATENYLLRSDEALWGVITWVHNNKEVLKNKNISITLHIGYMTRSIDYWEGDLSKDINAEDAEKAVLAYGKYKGKEDFAASVGKIVSAMLNIPYIPPDETVKIPAYLISTTTFGSAIPYQFEKSHVFKGALPGQMKNYAKDMRFIVFWDRESAQAYIDEYINPEDTPEYVFRQITLSKENVFDIFDILY